MEWDIADKTVLITGGNSGIGRATAVDLAHQGADVIITSRNRCKGEEAAIHIANEAGYEVSVVYLDLASLDSVHACAREVLASRGRLDVLINNAGLISGRRRETNDGFEMMFGVNHLGHFLLTGLLLDRLRDSAPSRIINVSSSAHGRSSTGLDFDDLQSSARFRTMDAYGNSKLANLLFTLELARRLEGTGVTAYALDPGLVNTRIARDGDTGFFFSRVVALAKPFFQSPAEGARTSVHLAVAPPDELINGAYYVSRKRATPAGVALSPDAARQLWQVSEELVDL